MAADLRRSVRALVVDEAERVLLCRHALATTPGVGVWAAPGGGVEQGEPARVALARELREEVGVALAGDPPLVWRQVIHDPGLAAGDAGVTNEYFLVRTAAFDPRGELPAAALAAENLGEVRWWSVEELASHAGADLLSPRDLAVRLSTLLREGVPAEPTALGL